MGSKNAHAEFFHRMLRCFLAGLCIALLMPGDSLIAARWMQEPTAAKAGEAAPESIKLTNEQLDSLVAPIALYPDPLLAQVLAASTYPLEIIQLQQWLEKNKNLKDKALADAVMKQNWDPSIQAMAGMPDVVKRLSDDIKWTAELGNAFLAQQSDIMEAVQRMRGKAKEKGNLKTTEQAKVETKVVENKEVIVIEQSNPQVVYVPSYDPVVVYGPPAYPYPPIYYPPPPAAGWYAAGVAISFGVGMAMGAAWGGGWGWGCGWGNNDIDIDVNNNFNRNTNRNTNVNRGGNTANIGSGNKWQHNSQHRGAAPYGDRSTANKYGGSARGDSAASRQAGARQNVGQQGGRAQTGSMDRGSADRSPGGSDRGAGASSMDRGGSGGDRVGDRSVSNSSRDSGSFGGASNRSSGSSARSSSSRGSSSFGGGGGSRGGGGGGRGGGGRR